MASPARLQSDSAARRREILERFVGLHGKESAAVLGVSRGTDPAAVKAAFVALAKRFHPDTLDAEDADLREPLQAVFIRITEAYRDLQGSPASLPPRAPGPAPASLLPPLLRLARGPCRETEPSTRPAPAGRPAPAPDPEPKHERVRAALAAAAASIAEGDASAAVSALHEVMALADGAKRRRVRTLLAKAYVSQPKWRRYGVSLLGELLRDAPEDAEALAILGALYHREGLLARADATLRRALASDPGHTEARIQHRAVIAAIEKQREAASQRPVRRGLVARLLSFAR
jgi:tetratricopeptide (TPR) repeat protein